MSPLQIAAIYIAANILILIWLSFRVVAWRRKTFGAANDAVPDGLARAIRVHGNASEYIPAAMLGLLVIALLAPTGPGWVVHVIGLVFTVGRVMHAIGYSRTILILRQLGIVLTWGALLGVVAALLWFALA